MSPQRYRLTYSVTPHEPPLSREEVAAMDGDMCAADALVLLSIVNLPGGATTQEVFSVDGLSPDRPLDVDQIWRAWFLLASALSDNEDLAPERRAVCERTCNNVRDLLAGQGARIKANV